MKYKSDVQKIFLLFKAKTEKQLGEKIIKLFSDNGGEYESLTPFLKQNGITSIPHIWTQSDIRKKTPSHCRKTLLYDSKLLNIFWTYAFQTTIYLINLMVSSNLENK